MGKFPPVIGLKTTLSSGQISTNEKAKINKVINILRKKRKNNTFASIEYIYSVRGEFPQKSFGTDTTNRTNFSKC